MHAYIIPILDECSLFKLPQTNRIREQYVYSLISCNTLFFLFLYRRGNPFRTLNSVLFPWRKIGTRLNAHVPTTVMPAVKYFPTHPVHRVKKLSQPLFSGHRRALRIRKALRVTAFTLDVRTSQALSASEKSSSRSIVRPPADPFPSGPKKGSVLPSKVRLDMGTKDDSLAEEEETNPTDVVIEISPQKIIHKEINWLPIYRGQINAFTLELFSMKDDVDERLAHDYLEAVFECFPDEEYCVVLIPPFFPAFPLLQSFVRVPLRFNKDYPLVMYLAHRASVIGNFRTREADPSDVTRVEELLAGVPKRSQVIKDLESALEEDSLYLAYVFLCEETLVGFAILRVEEEIEFIRSHYRIEDHISFDNVPIDSHGRIIHLTMMPIFANLHRYFFLELMRLSDKRALYYRLYHSDASALTRSEPLVTFLGEMIPVTPRRRLKYCLDNYPDAQPADYVLQESVENFALYMMVPRIASIQKLDVNVRVIVVGASDCGLSVLETLAFGPNASTISFTNLTLISRDGIPFENRPDDMEKNELPFKGRYSRDYRHLIGTRAWINVVHGTLTAINRKDKFVKISSMGALSYDYLVLACGLQYHRPKFLKELRAEKKGNFNNYPTPENCLTINTERDAANSLNYCQRVVTDNPACSVILYGKNIDCYSALAMLLKSDLRPDNITLVEPAVQACDTENSSFLSNDEVEEAVIKATKESGVNIVPGGDLVDWILEEDEEDVFIVSVIIEQGGELRELVCDVLFNFKKKTINTNTFLAICESGLVFDGALVIDPEFQTNDPCIFAAGTMTKYSRKFYADEVAHKYYDLFEVGEKVRPPFLANTFLGVHRVMISALCSRLKLGQKLRDIICSENGAKANEAPLSKLDMMLPIFKKPIVTSCRLPGDYYYLNIKRPGNLIWDDVNDVVMITGSPNSSIGYFQLHLNQFDTVESITCLSRKEFEVENYISLYGKHQNLLNDLKMRFQNSMIPDLYSYFREPWAVALFLDRFDLLRAENKAILQSPTVVCDDALINDCTKALMKSKWEAMKPEDQEMIEARYAGSAYQEELENNLIDFLQHSEAHLPMYCNPRFLRRFMDDVEKLQGDPLFPKPDIWIQ
nr:cilia- and flagella-associated protein 61-like isoform X1 [Neodiprion pinetum]